MIRTLLACLLFSGTTAYAAKNGLSLERKTPEKRIFSFSKQQKKHVLDALKVPMKNRLAIYNKKPRRSYYILKAIAFDTEQHMQDRWRALTSLAAVGKARSAKLLAKAAKSKTWYMRNAALLSGHFVDNNFASMMAADLLHDPSLIVRTEAVRVLKKTNAVQYKDRLKQQLNSPQNFRKNKSLWVRKHIAEALYQFMDTKDKQIFVKMLDDQDPQVQKYGVLGMERYYQRRISDSKKLSAHVEEWKRQIVSL
ncbi:MAG: hypothetical protein CL677_08715 [Bdellovibrionaceae bacterium]|nr:hypothetical protein [Pseudobdellovibrionaceae bacterium]|tara:strand:+ start:184 stop:939 length:756 start_codon:yes stop_codon:yes gene_type:complete